MKQALNGIHHVTAICRDAQENLDFYVGLLGMRFIKKTVNFDDPSAYHLYYGDDTGSPGSILTFFPYPDGVEGTEGSGQAVAVRLATPNLAAWQEKLAKAEIPWEKTERFGESYLALKDPDGLQIELSESESAGKGITRVAGVTLWQDAPERSHSLYVDQLGFELVAAENDWRRYSSGDSQIDVKTERGAPRGRVAKGSIHHIAFRTPDDASQLEWLKLLQTRGYQASPVMDRNYFHSIYFREPGGVLFEIATDTPGFGVDEPMESLGRSLKLPNQFEPFRAEVEARLPELKVPVRTI